jgi:hypothetical protein
MSASDLWGNIEALCLGVARAFAPMCHFSEHHTGNEQMVGLGISSAEFAHAAGALNKVEAVGEMGFAP